MIKLPWFSALRRVHFFCSLIVQSFELPATALTVFRVLLSPDCCLQSNAPEALPRETRPRRTIPAFDIGYGLMIAGVSLPGRPKPLGCTL
jgi:hypothetical protein